jgi:predicted GNAT family acetyltransferase
MSQGKAGVVRHNHERQRFEIDTTAGVADYRIEGDTIIMYHTEVPVPVRGRTYGYKLVCGALEEIRRLNLKVVPQCWFVRDVIDRRPEFKDLLA